MSNFNIIKDCRHGKMVFNPLDAYVGRSLNEYGEFSEGEAALFRQIVREGSVVLEIGANIGAHTVMLSKLAGPSGAVFAFEPQRIIFQNLAANLSLNSIINTFCYQKAVGEVAGTLLVPVLDFEKENNWGGLSLGSWQHGEKVEVVTVDSLALPNCNFLKIDVEGMELSVLKGATQTITKFHPVMYIENDREEKSDALIRYIDYLDYDIYWHCPYLFNPDNFNRVQSNVFGNIVSKNVLCVHKSANTVLEGFSRVQVPGQV